MKTTAKREEVLQAIKLVNEKHGYKIELKRDDQTGKWFNFTLKTKSGIPGARTSWNGRNLPCASWHAHGYLFDEIFRINPKAIIESNRDKQIAFHWNDRNIGSLMHPIYMSETSIL